MWKFKRKYHTVDICNCNDSGSSVPRTMSFRKSTSSLSGKGKVGVKCDTPVWRFLQNQKVHASLAIKKTNASEVNKIFRWWQTEWARHDTRKLRGIYQAR